MLESALARLLNHHLGKYILDFDSDNLNVGIFSGDIRLTDLNLKPEALYELNLPIAVKYGKVESILINIPWSFLRTRPVTVTVQGIWVIAEPCIQNGTPEREKRLIRASRLNILNETTEKIFSQLFAAFQFNLQITVNDVHFRFEDDASKAACGLCLQSISLQTTDRKWKTLNDTPNTTTTFQILKIESLSTYWDSKWEGQSKHQDFYSMRNELANGLKTFTFYEKPYDFLLKPATLKMKITIRRVNDDDNHIQIDASLGDCVIQATRAQIQSMQRTYSLLSRCELLRQWITTRPVIPIKSSPKPWWQYAYLSVLQQRVYPYTWRHIEKTRKAFKQYRDTYIQYLEKPSAETELKLDLLKCEDLLTLSNIILAREEAKLLYSCYNEEVKLDPEELQKSHLSKLKAILLNLAIGNGTITLDNDEQEVLSIHLSQLAVCAEAGVLTLRLHTLVVEGLSNEDHLVPIISSSGYDSTTPIVTIEVKRNLFEGQYLVKCNLESLEFTYNEFLVAELFNFLTFSQIKLIEKFLKSLRNINLPSGMFINLTIKRPKFIIPETGCLQKGSGSLLIFSPGLIEASREGMQDPDLEAGLAELEERLYTRWTVSFKGAQILLAESGEAWREALEMEESPMHFLTGCTGEAILLSNICPSDKRLPLRKYNLAIQTLKVALSTRKLTMFLDIVGNLPVPKAKKHKPNIVWEQWPSDRLNPQLELHEFRKLQQSISTHISNSTALPTSISTVESNSTSEVSDFADEYWARLVDLPGFEDNVSPSNPIQLLVRCTIDETCLTISRMDGRNERTFLRIRFTSLCFEAANLAFGPAIQFNIQGILVTEQFHVSPTGNYLELVSSGTGQDVLSILYRKVTADCPDFRTHFRSVENSLVVDLGHLRLRWRSDACRAVVKYVRRVLERVRNSKAIRRFNWLWKKVKPVINDPPIPPGAVKFSKSLRISSTRLTLADTQADLLELYFCGFEYDFMFRANEKVQFRVYLGAVTIEDLTHLTLYHKILGMEDDYFLELKYVGHPSHISQGGRNGVNLSCDGNLKVQLGRIQAAPLGAKDLKKILRPIPIDVFLQVHLQRLLTFLLRNKLLLSLQIGGPTLLIPHKLDSPNVIIVHKGDISVENFFSETNNGVMDNILIKIEGASVSRAVMSLGGSLQIQGNILEPISIRLDVKRNINGSEPIWSINGSTDTIRVTVGQCDLSLILAIWTELVPKTRVSHDCEGRDRRMSELQAFLSQRLQQKIAVKISVDGFCLEVVSDCDEILSSPIRDMNRSLCRLMGHEFHLTTSVFSDSSWKLAAVLKSISFTDTKLQNGEEISGTILNVEINDDNTSVKEISVTSSDFELKLSTFLIVSLYQFIQECMPPEWPYEGGLENQGYEKESTNLEPSLGSKIKVNLSTFSVIVISQNTQFIARATLQFFHSIETYVELADISIEMNTANDIESIVGPFNIKVAHTITSDLNKISIILSEMNIILSPQILHNCLKLTEEIQPQNYTEDPNDEDLDLDFTEDMWLPKKITPKSPDMKRTPTTLQSLNETIIFVAPSISLIVNSQFPKFPLIISRITCDFEMREHCNLKLTIQSNYFNVNNNMWEPLIEPVGNDFSPYELNVHIFRTAALPITSKSMQTGHKLINRIALSTIPNNVTDTSGDSDSDSGEIMSFMKPPPERVLISPSPPLGIAGEFESDGEDDVIERITSTLSYLFTSDSSDEQDSDSSSDPEPHEIIPNEPTYDDINPLTSIQEVATYFVIDSKDRFELTLTPNSISILTKLFDNLTNPHWTETNQNDHLNIIHNNLGTQTKVELRDAKGHTVCSSKCDESGMESNTSSPETSPTKTNISKKKAPIDVEHALSFHKYTTAQLYKKLTSSKLHISITQLSELELTCPSRSTSKIVRLQPSLKGKIYHAVVDVKVDGMVRTITTRSPLQIRNETSYVLGVVYQSEQLRELNIPLPGEAINPFEGSMRVTLLQPHQTYDVPLFIAYHCKLFIQPAHLDSSISDGILWDEIAVPHIETCKMKINDERLFHIGVVSQEKKFKTDVPKTVPLKVICLLPPLIVHNCLPRDLKIFLTKSEQYQLLESSSQMTFYKINPLLESKLDIEFDYYGLTWTGTVTLGKDLVYRTIVMSCVESTTEKLSLLIRANWNTELAACHAYIHAPFWILNRTDLDLKIKGCGSDVLTSLHPDLTTLWTWPRGVRRKCIRVRVAQANWSNAFPIDTNGCTGRVICRDRSRGKRYRLLLNINHANATPLTTIVVFSPMFVVTNHTDHKLRFMEENENADLWFDISPGESVPFWPETESMHMYVKFEDNRTISQRFPITKQQHTVLRMGRNVSALCVSVTGGETSSFTINYTNYRPGNAPLMIINQCMDIFLKFNQKGLSQTALLSPQHSLLYTWDDPSAERQLIWNLYNNKGRGFELQFHEDGEGDQTVDDNKGGKLYIAWVSFMKGSQRTVVFGQHKIYLVQHQYLERAQLEVYISLKGFGLSLCTRDNKELAYYSISDRPAKWEVSVSRKWKELTPDLSTWIEEQYQWNREKCHLKDYLEIDLTRMLLIKPFFGDLRRSYSPGVWVQYRQSAMKQYIHMEVQNMQLDNQFSELPIICQFTDKNFPCVEVFSLWSATYRTIFACSVQIRDMSISLDTKFLKKWSEIWREFGIKDDQARRSKKDMKILYSPFAPKEKCCWSIQQMCFASFTIQLSSYPGVDYLKSYFDVSRIQDKAVILRVGSIDLKNIYRPLTKICEIISSHFVCTVMQQFYALVLGQTVLLNPQEFGHDKVYIEIESLGSIGLSEAAKRLLGHTRGAEPPHTATLFPSSDYSYKNTRTSSDISEAMLIISGLCGSQSNGEHVFRTALRSLLGFTAKDMFDSTGLIMESIYRSQPNAIMRFRLPRVCDNFYLEPYSWRRAVGQYFLSELSGSPEQYWAHASIDSNAKRVAVISFTTVYVARKKQLWAGWEIDWKMPLDCIVAIPTIDNGALVFQITEDQGEKLGSDKYKLSGDISLLNWLKTKIEEVMIMKIEDEQWCG